MRWTRTYSSSITALRRRSVLDDDAIAEPAGRLERDEALVLRRTAAARRRERDRELLRADVCRVLRREEGRSQLQRARTKGAVRARTLVPFFVTVAFVKLLPVPVTSTSAEVIWREPSTPLHTDCQRGENHKQWELGTHLLKLVIVATNVLSARMVITPEVSNVCAMFVFPHGLAVDGR